MILVFHGVDLKKKKKKRRKKKKTGGGVGGGGGGGGILGLFWLPQGNRLGNIFSSSLQG